MFQKFTTTERTIVLNKEDQAKIAKGLAKTSKVALHELTDEERKEILDGIENRRQ